MELNDHAAYMRTVEQELAGFTKQWHAKHGITEQAVREMEKDIMGGDV